MSLFRISKKLKYIFIYIKYINMVNLSESCPTFNEEVFNQTINKINEITEGKFESDLASCEDIQNMTVGGKKMRGKKMRGGFKKGHIKTAIYAILAVLACISLAGEGTQVIITGIRMIINGECGWLTNRLWFQHPMCAYWNYLVSVVGKAIIGDPLAITQLTGATIALVNAPRSVDAIVDGIARTVASRSPELTDSDSNNLDYSYGGKKSKRSKISKRSNKSRKSRKTRKSRKSRKTRK